MDYKFAHYDKKLITILEILSSHFVDLYYNHVYTSALRRIEHKGSLTDEYIRQVQIYVVGIKKDQECYKTAIQKLHEYFQKITRHSIMSFTNFVDRIIQQFFPPEYYDLLQLEDKDEALGSIIVDLVSGLGAYITTPKLLARIIDEHEINAQVTIRMIQDYGIMILLTKRGTLYNNFLQNIGQVKNTVPIEIVENLKQELQNALKEKNKLTKYLEESKNREMILGNKITQAAVREEKFKKLVRMLYKAAGDTAGYTHASVSSNSKKIASNTNISSANVKKDSANAKKDSANAKKDLANTNVKKDITVNVKKDITTANVKKDTAIASTKKDTTIASTKKDTTIVDIKKNFNTEKNVTQACSIDFYASPELPISVPKSASTPVSVQTSMPASTLASTPASTLASTLASTSASTSASMPASTLASTPASTLASTPASTSASTPASMPAYTSASQSKQRIATKNFTTWFDNNEDEKD